MRKTCVEGEVSHTQKPEEEDLGKILCEIAETSEVSIQDLPQLLAVDGSVVWEKLISHRITVDQVTDAAIDLAVQYQTQRSLLEREKKIRPPTKDNPDAKGSPMKLDYGEVKKLFHKMGFKNIESRKSWPKEKVETYLNERLETLVNESMFDSDEDDLLRLFRNITRANNDGIEISIENFDQGEVLMPVAAKAKGGRPRKERTKTANVVKTKKAGSANGPLLLSQRKIGVVDTIITLLKKAHSKKPISKRDILEVLVKKYGPDTEYGKDPKGMWSTINTQMSTKLKDRGYTISRNEKGFWMED